MDCDDDGGVHSEAAEEMKRARTIVWMVLAIGALVGLRFVLTARSSGRSARLVRESVLAASAERATGFVVRREGEAAIVLEEREGAWRICEPFEGAAAESVVKKLGDALAFREVEDALSDAELLRLGRGRGDFGLEVPRLTVEVCAEGLTNEVYFGGATATGAGVYAAIGGSDLVYVVPTDVVAAVDLAAADFLLREVMPAGAFPDVSAVSAFDVRRAAGAFVRLEREGEKWSMIEPRKEVASAARVRNFLGKILAARACDFVWPVGASNEAARSSIALLAGYGLDSESATTITLRGVDGRDASISFGKDAGPNLVYALVQGGEAIVTLAAGVKDEAQVASAAFLDARLFPYEAREVTAFSLADGEATYLLSRGAKGTWRLDSPIVAEANQAVVESLLTKLLTMNAADLEAGGMRVSLSTNAEPVEVSREGVLANHRLADLRAKEICRVEAKDVTRVVVTKAGEKPTAIVWNAERRVWDVEESAMPGLVNERAIAAVFEVMNPLTASSIVAIKVSATALGTYGLATPRATLALDFAEKDAVRRNLLIGNPAKDGYYATIGSSDAIFILPQETVERILAPLVSENVVRLEK